MADTEPRPESVNNRLASYLAEYKDGIINEWMDRVRKNTAIKTGRLNVPALKDHLPELFDDLIEALRCYPDEGSFDQIRRDSVTHAVERWRQGYDLAEFMREIADLRTVFIYHLRLFEELHADFGMVPR